MSNEVFNITVFEKMRNVTGSRNLVVITSFTFKSISSNQIFQKCFWFGVIHILLHTETQDSPPLPSSYPRPRHDKSYLWLSKYLVGMAFWMLIPQDIRRACGTVNLTQNFSLLRCGQPSSLAPKMFGFFGDVSSLTTPSPLWLPPHPKWCVKCGRPLFVKFYRQDFTKGF